jgi:hypothetical protein
MQNYEGRRQKCSSHGTFSIFRGGGGPAGRGFQEPNQTKSDQIQVFLISRKGAKAREGPTKRGGFFAQNKPIFSHKHWVFEKSEAKTNPLDEFHVFSFKFQVRPSTLK